MSERKDELNFNGTTSVFLSRFARLEERVDAGREADNEIKKDIKEIKAAMIPLLNQVYFHDRLLKIGGGTITVVVGLLAALSAAGVL